MYISEQEQHNRIQSFAFLVGICFCILTLLFVYPGHVANNASASIELCDRVNPNNAPVSSLMRLPGIGSVRATALVAYRMQFEKQTGSKTAFSNSNDLQKIKGIGPKTVEKIEDFLTFD